MININPIIKILRVLSKNPGISISELRKKIKNKCLTEYILLFIDNGYVEQKNDCHPLYDVDFLAHGVTEIDEDAWIFISGRGLEYLNTLVMSSTSFKLTNAMAIIGASTGIGAIIWQIISSF